MLSHRRLRRSRWRAQYDIEIDWRRANLAPAGMVQAVFGPTAVAPGPRLSRRDSASPMPFGAASSARSHGGGRGDEGRKKNVINVGKHL
jgi:hypothetical protein